MSNFPNVQKKVFILLEEHNIPEKISDKIQKFNEKNYFVRTQRLIKSYSKLLRRKSIDIDGLLKEIQIIRTDSELYRYKDSILTAIKERIPDEKKINEAVLNAKSKDEVVNFLKSQPSIVSVILKRNKIYPFNTKRKKRKTKRQFRAVNQSKEIFGKKSQIDDYKFNIYKSRILQCLKKRKVLDTHLDFLKKLDSMDKIVVFLDDALPKESKYLKKKGIPPFDRIKSKKQIKTKGPYVKIIYTPMGNKR